MLNIVRKSLSVVLILTMIFSVFAINTSANTDEEENTIMPRFSVINSVATSFTIRGETSMKVFGKTIADDIPYISSKLKVAICPPFFVTLTVLSRMMPTIVTGIPSFNSFSSLNEIHELFVNYIEQYISKIIFRKEIYV